MLPLLSTLLLTYAALSDFSVQNHVSVLSKIRTGVCLAVQCSMRTPGSNTRGAKGHRILGFTLTRRWGLWGLPGPGRIPELHQFDGACQPAGQPKLSPHIALGQITWLRTRAGSVCGRSLCQKRVSESRHWYLGCPQNLVWR